MAINVTGQGYFGKRQAGRFHPLALAQFSFASTEDIQKSYAFPECDIAPLQVSDETTKQQEYQITANIQSLDSLDIDEWVFGQKSSTQTNVLVPKTICVTVPETSPYNVTVTGLTVDQAIEATVLTAIAPGKLYLTQIASAGTPTDGQFEVTADTVSFAAEQAGKKVAIWYFEEEASITAIGGSAGFVEVGTFEMVGRLTTTRTNTQYLWMPRVRYNGGFTLDGSADNAERTMTALIDPDRGFTLPYLKWTIS